MLVAAAPVAAKEGDALRSGGSAAAGMAVTIGALLLGGPSDAAVTEVTRTQLKADFLDGATRRGGHPC